MGAGEVRSVYHSFLEWTLIAWHGVTVMVSMNFTHEEVFGDTKERPREHVFNVLFKNTKQRF